MRRRVASIALSSLLAVASGCYRYLEVPATELQPGMDLRAQVSGVGVERLRRGGEAQSRVLHEFTLEGVVLETRPDSVLFSVPSSFYEGDFRARVLTQEVVLARSELVRMETRRLDRARTAFVAIGVGAAAIYTIIAVTRDGGASGGIPVHGGPGEVRVPLGFHWTVR
ncbi:MAG: hypothetical protein JWL61_4575 [Gemmatimonadetes bacterium]|nr:hypothetical protein [Gemmatimonadota bacterium]